MIISVNSSQLKRALAAALIPARNANRPHLHCVWLAYDGERLMVCGSDGFMICEMAVTAGALDESDESDKAILPTKTHYWRIALDAAEAFHKVLSKSESHTHLTVKGQTIIVDLGFASIAIPFERKKNVLERAWQIVSEGLTKPAPTMINPDFLKPFVRFMPPQVVFHTTSRVLLVTGKNFRLLIMGLSVANYFLPDLNLREPVSLTSLMNLEDEPEPATEATSELEPVIEPTAEPAADQVQP